VTWSPTCKATQAAGKAHESLYENDHGLAGRQRAGTRADGRTVQGRGLRQQAPTRSLPAVVVPGSHPLERRIGSKAALGRRVLCGSVPSG
jgi:hypothetical protein